MCRGASSPLRRRSALGFNSTPRSQAPLPPRSPSGAAVRALPQRRTRPPAGRGRTRAATNPKRRSIPDWQVTPPNRSRHLSRRGDSARGSAIPAYWEEPEAGQWPGAGLGGRLGAWPRQGYLNLARRGSPVQSAQCRWGCGLVLCASRLTGSLGVYARVCGGGPVPPGSAAPGPRLSLLRLPRAPPQRDFSASLVRCVCAEGGRPPGPRPFPPRSRPEVCGASLWMRPRSPGREAASGKRCLRGFTAAWESDPRRRRPLPRGGTRRPGSAAAPGRRHGREVPARADGGEGLAGPVLHPRPAAGQPRWGPAERRRFIVPPRGTSRSSGGPRAVRGEGATLRCAPLAGAVCGGDFFGVCVFRLLVVPGSCPLPPVRLRGGAGGGSARLPRAASPPRAEHRPGRAGSGPPPPPNSSSLLRVSNGHGRSLLGL